jgi:hypothetical protein
LRHDSASGGHVGGRCIRFDALDYRADDLPEVPRLHGWAIHSVSCNGVIGGELAASGGAGALACSDPHGRANESDPHSCRTRTSCFDPELKTPLKAARFP